MSLSRIPLQQVFRSRTASLSVGSASSIESASGPTTVPTSVFEEASPVSSADSSPPARQPGLFTFAGFANNFAAAAPPPPPQPVPFAFPSTLTMATPVGRGTRTPQMLEYERQAEERAREADAMAAERELMATTESKIQAEQTRIAQEEYEMRQYYEAEALKHTEEMRLHAEEVRRHQERVREHERRVLDHEASSEAFAKVIAMPVKQAARRQVSFLAGTNGNRNGATNGN